ncbi:MAG: DUF63 family protein [Methanosarcinaceae archaeon]|nr:DUF63 family protein [Methanosarcinaceae archaeon]MDD4748556.1 DUF63 family protein [Methanosarcinaceae archaeon]
MNSLIDKISQFINVYYLNPIRGDSGYNVVNTLTWALILGICIFGVFRLLNTLKVRINSRFIASVLPFVLAGSSLRVLEDAGIFEPPWSYLFITPNIYFLVFGLTVFCLWVSLKLEKAGFIRDFHLAFAGLGLLWFLGNLTVLFYVEDLVLASVPFFVLGAGGSLALGFYWGARKLKSKIFTDPLNLSILLAHFLDASSTVIGVDKLGYYEKHVLPAYLIDLTGTALVMYPLKLIIFIGVLYILDTQFEEDEETLKLAMLVKMVILILGLSPACRNTIRMTFGI